MKNFIKNCIFLIICIAAVFISITATKSVLKIIYPLRYDEFITKYSNEYSLDEYMVMSLIKAESNYIYDANSGVAKGLMQLTDETALWIAQTLGIEFDLADIENPETNIKMGCYYLSYLNNYYNHNINLALAAYNAGMGNVDSWLADTNHSLTGESLDNIPFAETENYVKKVINSTSIYKKLYQK